MPRTISSAREWAKRPGVAVVAGCLALAALSLLAPSTPTTDSWGWIIWGREVAHLDLSTDVGGAPAWKPLPVLFTAVLSLGGDAAPELWLWLSRAAWLVAVALAFRLAARLAGPWAGAVAAIALVLCEGALRSAAHGYSEGLVLALLLLAIERHLDERPNATLTLLFLAGLARPEAWLFFGLYALRLWRSEQGSRKLAVGLLIATAVLWVGADWWGSGELFHGSGTARATDADLVWYELLGAGAGIVGLPALVLAALACADPRRRGPAVLLLGASALAWTVLLCVLVTAGWPASPRFLVPATGPLCVLAGVGAVRAVEAAGRPRARRLALACLLVLAAAPAVVPQASRAGESLVLAERRALLEDELRRVVRAAGEARMHRCGAYVMPVEFEWSGGAVAWELDAELGEVETLQRTVELPALAAAEGPVLAFEAEPERGAVASGERSTVVYPLPDGMPRCLAVAVPLAGRPLVLGGGGAGVRLLARGPRWRVWTVRLGPTEGAGL